MTDTNAQIRQQVAVAVWALGEHGEGSMTEDYLAIARRRFEVAVKLADAERAAIGRGTGKAKAKAASA